MRFLKRPIDWRRNSKLNEKISSKPRRNKDTTKGYDERLCDTYEPRSKIMATTLLGRCLVPSLPHSVAVHVAVNRTGPFRNNQCDVDRDTKLAFVWNCQVVISTIVSNHIEGRARPVERTWSDILCYECGLGARHQIDVDPNIRQMSWWRTNSVGFIYE